VDAALALLLGITMAGTTEFELDDVGATG
jgi:hypothetical protein